MTYQLWRDRLAEANPPELYPVEWLDAEIANGRAHPIIGEKSAMVVGVRLYPGGARVGHVLAAAGDMDEIRDTLAPQAEAMGRRMGCRMVMLEGREGWKKAMKEHGWSTHQVVLVKDL